MTAAIETLKQFEQDNPTTVAKELQGAVGIGYNVTMGILDVAGAG